MATGGWLSTAMKPATSASASASTCIKLAALSVVAFWRRGLRFFFFFFFFAVVVVFAAAAAAVALALVAVEQADLTAALSQLAAAWTSAAPCGYLVAVQRWRVVEAGTPRTPGRFALCHARAGMHARLGSPLAVAQRALLRDVCTPRRPRTTRTAAALAPSGAATSCPTPPKALGLEPSAGAGNGIHRVLQARK